MEKFFVFRQIKLKFCSWLYKKRWHTLCKFQLEIRSNKKVIAKKPLTNLYEMNSRPLLKWIKLKQIVSCFKSSIEQSFLNCWQPILAISTYIRSKIMQKTQTGDFWVISDMVIGTPVLIEYWSFTTGGRPWGVLYWNTEQSTGTEQYKSKIFVTITQYNDLYIRVAYNRRYWKLIVLYFPTMSINRIN